MLSTFCALAKVEIHKNYKQTSSRNKFLDRLKIHARVASENKHAHLFVKKDDFLQNGFSQK